MNRKIIYFNKYIEKNKYKVYNKDSIIYNQRRRL